MGPIQWGVVAAVPAGLGAVVYLGVQLVRWAQKRPQDAASAALNIYVNRGSGIGRVARDVVESLSDD